MKDVQPWDVLLAAIILGALGIAGQVAISAAGKGQWVVVVLVGSVGGLLALCGVALVWRWGPGQGRGG